MTTKFSRVTVLAPGCFSMVAKESEPELNANAAQGDSHSGGAAAVVDNNDSSAIATGTKVYEQALSSALGQPIPAMGELPIALYQYPSDTGEHAPDHCVCAEFVHLQADKDNARLVPEAALNIEPEESIALMDALNKLLEPDGLRLHRSEAGQCYFTGMPADTLDTWPAHAVANGKIANYLPRHAEAGDWRRLITEVQMLFHSHPVNSARAELQQLPINGMWFWGGNKTTEVVEANGILLMTDHAYAKGLAKAVKANTISADTSTWLQVQTDYAEGESIDRIVIVDHSTYNAWLSGDHTALANAKTHLHDKWIAPLQHAVTNGLVEEFVLDGCEGQAIVERQASQKRGVTGVNSLSNALSSLRATALRIFGSKNT